MTALDLPAPFFGKASCLRIAPEALRPVADAAGTPLTQALAVAMLRRGQPVTAYEVRELGCILRSYRGGQRALLRLQVFGQTLIAVVTWDVDNAVLVWHTTLRPAVATSAQEAFSHREALAV